MSALLFTNTPVAFKNIITDYGAVADGVTDCTTAFSNFRTFARTQTGLVSLLCPPGSYAITLSGPFHPFSGIKNLVISGYGATFVYSGVFIATTTNGYLQAANKTARLQTVAENEQSATVVTLADAAIFSVGDWCAIGALEWQGTAGYPPNLHYNEFVQISDITGGVISFTAPVTQDYSSLYPETTNYPISPTTYDVGGPATLYKLGGTLDPSDSWDTQVAIYGVTFHNTGADARVYSQGRSMRYIDCTFTNCSPSMGQNVLWSAKRITCLDAQIEVDKNIEYAEFINCALKQFAIQSSSVRQLVVDGCSFTGNINGSPRKLLIKGASSVTSFQVGAQYGSTEEVIIQSPAVISALSGNESNRSAYSTFTQSGGNLTYTGAVGTPLPFAAPGTLLSLTTATRKSVYGSVCLDVTASGHETVLHTSFADPLPTIPVAWGTPNYVKQHPCLAMTVDSGVTGCPQIVALAGGVAAEPLFSNLDYTGTWMSANTFQVRGQLVSVTIDVLTAYTGAQSTANLHFGGQFDNFPVRLADGTAGTFAPIVNTKIVGTRVITPTTVTGSQSGDTLGSAPGLIWFIDFGGLIPIVSGSFGGDTAPQLPSVRIIIALDQAP